MDGAQIREGCSAIEHKLETREDGEFGWSTLQTHDVFFLKKWQ